MSRLLWHTAEKQFIVVNTVCKKLKQLFLAGINFKVLSFFSFIKAALCLAYLHNVLYIFSSISDTLYFNNKIHDTNYFTEVQFIFE